MSWRSATAGQTGEHASSLRQDAPGGTPSADRAAGPGRCSRSSSWASWATSCASASARRARPSAPASRPDRPATAEQGDARIQATAAPIATDPPGTFTVPQTGSGPIAGAQSALPGAQTGGGTPAGPPAPVMAELQDLRGRLARNPKDLAALVGLGNMEFDARKFEQGRRLLPARAGARPVQSRRAHRRRGRAAPERPRPRRASAARQGARRAAQVRQRGVQPRRRARGDRAPQRRARRPSAGSSPSCRPATTRRAQAQAAIKQLGG